VLEYYAVLRSTLRSDPSLRRCLKRCVHCRIFFLTHPRNASRRDLRCPFGCREVHRKQQSAKRSAAYYAEERGRVKKARQNRKRYLKTARLQKQEDGAAASPPAVPPILKHVRMVVGLIAGRSVSWGQIERLAERNWRQHRIGWWKKVVYVLRRLNKDPP
jgi:hypothetical protein